MLIGIVTDIHDDVERLTAALERLRGMDCDTIVCLGDATDFHGPHNRAWEVARLLQDYGVVGVWGNHDFGLCRDVPLHALDNPDHEALAYYATWLPRLEVGGHHFSHVEPWLDATDPLALWYFDGPPDTPEKLARSFAAVPHRAMFTGHFHKWLAGTEAELLDWRGDRPLVFDPAHRYLIVIGPLFGGAFATLDTDTRTLTPYQLP